MAFASRTVYVHNKREMKSIQSVNAKDFLLSVSHHTLTPELPFERVKLVQMAGQNIHGNLIINGKTQKFLIGKTLVHNNANLIKQQMRVSPLNTIVITVIPK